MKLIGTLDSPYVRRVAISLDFFGINFEHEPLSVFRTFEEFSRINPVVKAPSLVLDDGVVLMDSTLIINYFETLSTSKLNLFPSNYQEQANDVRTLGLALVACEKTVQIVYENNLRPSEKFHHPWIERVTQQLLAACRELNKQLEIMPLQDGHLNQASITSAVTWSFMQLMLPNIVRAEDFPAIKDIALALEQTELFKRYPIC